MTTINGRAFGDLSELEQWLVVALTKNAEDVSNAVQIMVNGQPCDLEYLALSVQHQLDEARLAGRVQERACIRRIIETSSSQRISLIMAALEGITDKLDYSEPDT